MSTRTRMSRGVVAVLMAGTLAGAGTVASAAKAARLPSGPTADKTDSELQAALDGLVAAGVIGVVARVDSRAGTRIVTSGVARRDTQEPMLASYGTRIGSITKTFVATVALQLVEEGRLRLDDTVEHHLPGVVPGGDGITVRQLMNHTSGLYNFTESAAWQMAAAADSAKLWKPMEVVTIAVAQPPLFAPGSRFSYSNTNYILVGLIVEAITHGSLDRQIERRITKPLKLRSTYLDVDNRVPAWLVHGYLPPSITARYPGLPAGYTDTTLWSPTWAWAAGAMVSTAADLSRFSRALMAGRLLRPATLDLMTTTVMADNVLFTEYGLGISLKRSSCGSGAVWGHDGGIMGYRSVVVTDRRGKWSAVLLMNTDSEKETTEPLFESATDLVTCRMPAR